MDKPSKCVYKCHLVATRDLGKLYSVETKRINEAVKNNLDKFPERFSWVLTNEEDNNLRSKFSTSSLKENYGGRRYNTRVFTEQGIYMLATILKSKVATEVSIRIMDTFVKMRHYINYNNDLLPNRVLLLEEKVDNNTKRIDELFDVLKNINKKIIIVSKNIEEILIKKYQNQYNNILFINNTSFHDRFIILDRDKLYSCGASFKDLRKKCFAINEIIVKDYLQEILKIINRR